MKKYEKLVEEFAKPTEGETATPTVIMAAGLGFEGGFLKCRKMALEQLEKHPDADSVPSWVFVCLGELGEEEV